MHNLSMVQALSLWSDLEAAYYGKHHYGGDVAEIYIVRAMTRDEKLVDSIMDANQSLYALFTHFIETHDAIIEINKRELGEWMKTAAFDHRIHVRVRRSDDAR